MLRSAVALLLFTLALFAADGEQQLAHIGDLKLQDGGVISDCVIGYRTFGAMNREHSNVMVFPTWFSGRSEALRNLIGAGNLADSAKYFVIAIDALGDGVSSSPSNSSSQPRMRFPRFTVRDMVESQHRLLTRMLHLTHVHAVMGISMGGMQTFEWMTSYPDFMDRAVPIEGSTRLTGADLLLWTAEKRAIENGADWKGGEYQAPPAATMALVGSIHDLALTTPDKLAVEVTPGNFAGHLAARDKETAVGFDANDWLRQLEAMIALDVSASHGKSMQDAARAVKAQVLVVVSRQDHMVNPGPAMEFAKMLGVQPLVLDSSCGHLASGCEAAKMVRAVQGFLQ